MTLKHLLLIAKYEASITASKSLAEKNNNRTKKGKGDNEMENKDDIGNISLQLNQYTKCFQQLFGGIRNNLKDLGVDEPRINDVIDKIKSKDEKFARLIKGELADVLKDQDDIEIIGITEIGFCHYLGLRHRTANAFVITPSGEILLSRRAPGRKYKFFISILGGHVKSGQNYSEAIREELQEELHLNCSPKGDIISLGIQSYKVKGIDNVENRKLYVYFLEPNEYEQVKEHIKILESKKNELMEDSNEDKNKAFDNFDKWLQDEQKKKSGFGEIWSYYEITIDQMIQSKSETIPVVDDKNINANLHYLDVDDRICGKENAHFTPDLLEIIIEDEHIMELLKDLLSWCKRR